MIETIGSKISILSCQIEDHVKKIDILNSDAEITDENIARLGCRIRNVENYFADRGLALS